MSAKIPHKDPLSLCSPYLGYDECGGEKHAGGDNVTADSQFYDTQIPKTTYYSPPLTTVPVINTSVVTIHTN